MHFIISKHIPYFDFRIQQFYQNNRTLNNNYDYDLKKIIKNSNNKAHQSLINENNINLKKKINFKIEFHHK